METKDSALELEVFPPDTRTKEGSIVQELGNTDNSSSESAILDPSVIEEERSEVMPTGKIGHDLAPHESTILNPSDVPEESPEGMTTVNIGQDSDPEDSKDCPDQGIANIIVQLLTKILKFYCSYVLFTIS